MVSRLLFLLIFSLLFGSRAMAEGSLSRSPLNESEFDALPAFSAEYYLRANGDLANEYGLGNYRAARQHWDSYGRYEGRPSSPAFHVRDYLELNADVQSQFGDDYGAAVWHFNTYGINEGRQSTHAYNVRDYIQLFGYRLSQGDFLAAHLDWINFGIDYGVQSDNDFAVYKYLRANPDLERIYGVDGYVDAYIHWLIRGRAEGRRDGFSRDVSNCSSGPAFAGGNRTFRLESNKYHDFVMNTTDEVTEIRDTWNNLGLDQSRFNVFPHPFNRKQVSISIDLIGYVFLGSGPVGGSWFFTMANSCGAASLSGDLVADPLAPPPPILLPPGGGQTCRLARYSSGSTTVSRGGSSTITLSASATSVDVFDNGSGVSASVNGTQLTVWAPSSSSATWYTVYAVNECGREAISGSITK